MDKEIQAMSSCFDVLKDLDAESQERVINWLLSKFELKAPNKIHQSTNQGTADTQNEQTGDGQKQPNVTGTELSSFESIADLFSKMPTKTESEKVLVVATFLQVNQNQQDLGGRQINSELKHLGHGVKNITLAVQGLINRKPQLMIQTRKSGNTQQAKKKYKVTSAGVNKIKEALNTGELVL